MIITAVTVSITFAIIEMILKFFYRILIFWILLVYIILSIISLFVTLKARHEMFLERVHCLDNFNNLNGPARLTSGHYGMPKYPMSINAEHVEDSSNV